MLEGGRRAELVEAPALILKMFQESHLEHSFENHCWLDLYNVS